MQQRRLRLGDILDDYCPRERRVTNHVIVALVEEEVKQTRCTTCDADHEYKQARVPLSRRKRPDAAAVPDPDHRPPLALPDALPADATPAAPAAAPAAEIVSSAAPLVAAADSPPEDDEAAGVPELEEEDGPVHRPLIRATLPRPEGQSVERKAPDFTLRQSGGRFDPNRNGGRQRGRPHQAQGGSGGQPKFGSRQGTGHAPQGQRPGNRSGNVDGGRSGRPQGPANRGGRQGGGQGRKRGR